jgi:hypothetical protein
MVALGGCNINLLTVWITEMSAVTEPRVMAAMRANMVGFLRPSFGFFRSHPTWNPAGVRFRIVYGAPGML